MKEKVNSLKNKLENAQNIIILSHVNPDGDTLGSNLALSLMIEKNLNKKVKSVYTGFLPSVYSYLPSYDKLEDINNIDTNEVYDLAIAIDVAAKDRMISGVKIFDNAKYRINIDHHKTNINYGDLNIVDGNAACVGIILYDVFKELNWEITLDVARCIYTSLMTDTGGFKYENTTSNVFTLASKLVEIGVSPCEEYRACYETKPQNMIQFQSYVISNTDYLENGQIAFTKVTLDDMAKFNATDDFTEGIVEVIRTSKAVKVAAILKETKDGYTKISLRSKDIDLAPIVTTFDGGGHTFAAGCTIKKPISIAYDKLLERVKSELK